MQAVNKEEALQPDWWKTLDFEGENVQEEDKNSLMDSWQGTHKGFNVPEFGWRIALSHTYTEQRKPWTLPKISQLPALVGLGLRYLRYHRRLKQKNKRPCMDFFDQQPLRQIYGVPLGGIGGGSINRGWRGDFCRWQLRPGIYTFETTSANQFIVCIRRGDKTLLTQVLNPGCPNDQLRDWNWRYSPSHAYYHALYPRAWTVYDIPRVGITLTCQQISPVIPHDYKDSSLPTAVFSWHVQNHNDYKLDVTIAMTMENGKGSRQSRKHSSGHWNEAFNKNEECVGVVMHNRQHDNMPFAMTIAAKKNSSCNVTRLLSFDPAGTGSDLWKELSETGKFACDKEKSEPTRVGEAIGCSVAATQTVDENSSSTTIDFSLAWDMPQVEFGDCHHRYNRRYTKFFGNQGDCGPALTRYALDNYPRWVTEIEKWQSPVVDNKKLPAWYKSAIFNEMYYITDGGTVWLQHDEMSQNGRAPKDNEYEEYLRNCEHICEYGKFAYLEGQEYRMFNTYDVHFYASIALASLWPNLELSVQYDIAASILHTDEEQFLYLMEGSYSNIKTRNCVPHDIGDPEQEPWRCVNAYFVHDTDEWKDLNPKFVLQVYRDFHITQNTKFLADMWPVCVAVMTHSMRHDKDGDGLIENSGCADQTFDGWTVTGPSAYCGGLWLAALRCMVAAAKLLKHEDEEEKYCDILKRGIESYKTLLWNGKYFNYDSNTRSSHSTSIMADQCAGQWFLLASEIADILPEEDITSALKMIFEYNVMKFAEGKRGAVNGMKPNGKIDTSSVQSDEVWTGVTYAVAATMLHKGMFKEGFITARGMYKTIWEQLGMSFQTPEAIKKESTYRSLAYMRPLSIWGMQYALENQK